MPSFAHCHLCGAEKLQLLDPFAHLHQVTSDCKPWTTGGKKGCCAECGAVQAAVDEAWKEACHLIYSSYTVYHQGGGQEQPVFTSNANAGTPRSLELLKKMSAEIDLPEQGRALDIGCGNGNFIRSFSALRPGWRLNGAEYNKQHQNDVLSISGVEGFYSGEIEAIPGPFDFISLIHVLEHIENPVPFLQKIAALAPSATLLIEVPFFRDNPYELLIADHATHYTPQTLSKILLRAGYSMRALHTDWILKEISSVAIVSPDSPPTSAVDPREELAFAVKAVDFLGAVKNEAKEIRTRSKSFGVFGTSIGGTWLWSELEGKLDFYVDEDPSRIGKKHLGVEILSPSQVPAGSSIFMPLAERVARAVIKKLQPSSPGTYHFLDSSES
jgi:SAM-dependent methyltransferase